MVIPTIVLTETIKVIPDLINSLTGVVEQIDKCVTNDVNRETVRIDNFRAAMANELSNLRDTANFKLQFAERVAQYVAKEKVKIQEEYQADLENTFNVALSLYNKDKVLFDTVLSELVANGASTQVINNLKVEREQRLISLYLRYSPMSEENQLATTRKITKAKRLVVLEGQYMLETCGRSRTSAFAKLAASRTVWEAFKI